MGPWRLSTLTQMTSLHGEVWSKNLTHGWKDLSINNAILVTTTIQLSHPYHLSKTPNGIKMTYEQIKINTVSLVLLVCLRVAGQQLAVSR